MSTKYNSKYVLPKNQNQEVNFPILKALMAKYGLTIKDIANITGNHYQTAANKMRLLYDFGASEMWKITEYFRAKGENVTVQNIFFDWISSNE